VALRLLAGDCRTILPTLPAESVHCVVTSPPYWGLRDYGVEGQIGLEARPEDYLTTMVSVFREVRRVLRPDGTLWLNMGDGYASPPSGHAQRYFNGQGASYERGGAPSARRTEGRTRLVIPAGLKAKDLVGMPWRLALALQTDGWFLRADIIWAKPNPMPESVTDRPTKAHEYVFLLAKGQWSTRVVQFANLPDEFCHLRNHRRLEASDSWLRALSVRLASAIFDAAQIEHDFGLPPLEAEVWQHGASNGDGVAIGGRPEMHRATMLAARFLKAQASAKEFLGELHRLWVALPDADDLLKAWVPAVVADAPGIYRDGKGTIAIKHAGQVCQLDLAHGVATIARPTGCSYYYDADAVREPVRDWTPTPGVLKTRDNCRTRTAAATGRLDGWTSPPRDALNPLGRNLRAGPAVIDHRQQKERVA